MPQSPDFKSCTSCGKPMPVRDPDSSCLMYPGESHVKDSYQICQDFKPCTKKDRAIRLQAVLTEVTLRPVSHFGLGVKHSSSTACILALLSISSVEEEAQKAAQRQRALAGSEERQARGRQWSATCVGSLLHPRSHGGTVDFAKIVVWCGSLCRCWEVIASPAELRCLQP